MDCKKIPIYGTEEQGMELYSWLEQNKDMQGLVLPALQKAQEIYGYVPRPVQQFIADFTGKTLSEVYGVATFYSQFNLEPKGRHQISVCLGTACYIKGAGYIYQLLQQMLEVEDGGCTQDGRFSLDSCRCLGCCGMAPVMKVNDDIYGNLTGEELKAILAKYE